MVPVFDEHDQPVMRLVASEVVRVTREPIGGHFGLDKGRRLVVALRDGDLLELRPEGTRQTSRMAIADIYAHMLRCEANRRHLEKARSSKIRKRVLREIETIKRMERRLRQ
jgi:hypothetical protein